MQPYTHISYPATPVLSTESTPDAETQNQRQPPGEIVLDGNDGDPVALAIPGRWPSRSDGNAQRYRR